MQYRRSFISLVMKNPERQYAIISVIMLCVSSLALSVSVLYNAERLYVLWTILMACSIGGLIGYRMKHKGDIKTFLCILLLAVISISLSLLLYAILRDNSVLYILLLNGCTLIYSMVLLMRQKRNSSKLSEN